MPVLRLRSNKAFQSHNYESNRRNFCSPKGPPDTNLWDEHVRRDYQFVKEVHALEMTVALFNSFILHESAGETFLLVDFLSHEKPRAGRESPLNLVLLLDRSHSMFGGPMMEVEKLRRS